MAGISNNEVKWVKSLWMKKNRDETGLFIVEGEKMLAEAMQSGFKVEKVYRRDEIGEEAMSRISSQSSPSPVLSVLHQGGIPFPEDGKGLFLALDGVRDPGNMGTILRIADWFGIAGVYVSPDTVELYNPKVVQSTMGSILRVPVRECDIPALCERVRASGKRVYGTMLDGKDIYGYPLEAECLIVMGNESEGLSPAVRAAITDALLIPSFASGPGAESLNVAVATAITVSEFRRRR